MKAKKVFENILFEEYLIGAFRNKYDGSLVHIYLNPKHIQNFDSWVRGISDSMGNFYLAKEGTILHDDMDQFLQKINESYRNNRKKGVVDLQRKGNTYNFYLGESWGFNAGEVDANEKDFNKLNKLTALVKERNSQFNFNVNETITKFI